jgi:hypothetical protein
MKLNLPFSDNSILLGLYFKLSKNSFEKKWQDQIAANAIFIHNPKVAGNSILKALGVEKSFHGSKSHKTPTFLMSAIEWDRTTTIVGIRHPIDRLVSSYYYHTKPEYKGVFSKRFSNLSRMSLEEYFEAFKSIPYVIMPQYYYTRHFLSKKEVDFLIRFENLEEDVKNLAERLDLEFKGLPHLNASKRPKVSLFKSQNFKEQVTNYYQKDFDILGYQPDFERFG